MKNKNLIISLLITTVIILVIGLSFIVYNNMKQEKEEKKQLENTIVTNYENFRNKTDSFNQARNTYFEEVGSGLFLESVEEDYEEWIKVLDQYTDAIDEVENSSKDLKNLCIDQEYTDENLRNKCASFAIAYETAINYYTKDMIEFNNLIQDYQKEDGSKKEIQEYTYQYEFTDVNSDGEFFGRD